MIESVAIQNFQSHKNTKLHLSPGVNVLVGPSDSGKSAIIRALIWLFQNRPAGTSNITYGETICSVCAIFKEGEEIQNTITRLRTPNDNMYIVNGKEYRVVGLSVPEEVSMLMNISEINFGAQFSLPVMIMDSPGDIARSISTVMKFDVVDAAMKSVSRKKVDTGDKRKETKAFIEQKKVELKKYDDLDSIMQTLERAATCSAMYDTLEFEARDLEDYIRGVLVTRDRIVQLENVLKGMDVVLEELRDYVDEYILEGTYAGDLGKLINDLLSVTKRESDLSRKQISLDTIKEVKVWISDLTKLSDEYSNLHWIALGIDSEINFVEAKSLDVLNLESKKKHLIEKYEEVFKKEGRCPLCFTLAYDIDMHTVEEMIGGKHVVGNAQKRRSKTV